MHIKTDFTIINTISNVQRRFITFTSVPMIRFIAQYQSDTNIFRTATDEMCNSVTF